MLLISVGKSLNIDLLTFLPEERVGFVSFLMICCVQTLGILAEHLPRSALLLCVYQWIVNEL